MHSIEPAEFWFQYKLRTVDRSLASPESPLVEISHMCHGHIYTEHQYRGRTKLIVPREICVLPADVRTEFCKSLKYDCLLLFLISSMPKEHYLAIESCALMANVSKHTLNIEHCLRLLGACLGHGCMLILVQFIAFLLRAIFQGVHASIRKHSMQSRWNDVVCVPMQVVEPVLTHFAVEFSHQKQHPQNSSTSSHPESAIQQSSLNESFTLTITIGPISPPEQPSKFSSSTF